MKMKAIIPVDVVLKPDVELSEGAYEALINYYTNTMGFGDFLSDSTIKDHFEESMDHEYYLEVKGYIDVLKKEIEHLKKMGEVDLDFAELES
jgi:hypothetical protein